MPYRNAWHAAKTEPVDRPKHAVVADAEGVIVDVRPLELLEHG